MGQDWLRSANFHDDYTPEAFKMKVCNGEIPGLSHVFKFGYNDAVSSTEETIVAQGGILVYPSSATQVKVSSSSPNDASAGTGLQTLRMFGLDGDYALAQEDITLNGQTEVLSSNSYIRIFRAYGLTAGSGGVNAGTIWFGDGDVTAGVPDTKFMAISIGDDQTLHTAYTIPASKTGYLFALGASSFGNSNVFITLRLVTREDGAVFRTRDKFTLTRDHIHIPHEWPVGIPAKTDIEVRGASSGQAVDCSAYFDLVLEDD